MAYIKDLRSHVGQRPLIMTCASGALLDAHQRVLLQERADTGHWGFPGGYMEYGETFRQTVIREYKEDAGLLIKPTKLLALQDNNQYTYPNGDQVQPVNAFFLVELVSDQQFATKPAETSGLRYFATDEEPDFFNHQHYEMWQIIRKYVRNLAIPD